MKLSENVPKEDWDKVKLRRVAHINPVKSEVRDLSDDIPVSFVEMEDIDVDGGFDLSETRPIGEVYGGYTYFRDGDVLVAKITPCFENGKGGLATELENGIGFGTTELHVLRSKEHLSPRFLEYITRSHPFRIKGEMEMTGAAGQQRVSEEFIAELEIPVPPEEKQRAIANFLDRNTAAIDELIDQKRRLIELLEEKRAAVINRAVTKGLDPDVPMKDSGIVGVGEVPKHWEVERNKNLFEERDERTETGDEELMTVSHKTGVTTRAEKEEEVNMRKAEDLKGYKICKPGDLCINTMWAWKGAVGIAKQRGAISPSYHVYRPKHDELQPDFYDYFYRTGGYITEMRRYSQGVWKSRMRLYPEVFLGKLYSPVPPADEQKEITQFLQKQVEDLSSSIQKLTRSIGKLEDYRQSLITAAVTGQIDVEDYEVDPSDDMEPPLRN